MVLVKATFQKTVRRFTIPDGSSAEDMRKKLVDVFPEMAAGTSPDSVVLYYKDSDNDLVIISSDEELHMAEHLVGEDNTLKLLVGVKLPEPKIETSQEEEDDLMEDFVHNFFSTPFGHHPIRQPLSIFGHNPFGSSPFGSSFMFDVAPSWSDRRRLLQQQEERVRRQREYEEKLRKAHQEHIKEMRERIKQAEEKRRKEEAEKKSNSGDVAVKEGDGNRPVIPNFPPGWVVNPYGSWEPVVHRQPGGGTTHVCGPWGYTASYGEKTEDTQEAGGDQKDQPAKEEEEPKEGNSMES